MLGANSASQMWKLYPHVCSFCTQTGLWQCFSRCLQKGSFSYLQCSACTRSFSSSVEVLCCIFQALGKKKSKGDQIRQIITSLSYFSLSVPPPPPLRFPLLTAISSLFCTLCPIALSVSLQCWLGGQEDDGCIWGLRGRRCRICLTCSSKDSVASSLSSNRAPGSLRQGGRWRIACVYVRAHACTCVCAWQLQRNIGEWWQVWY